MKDIKDMNLAECIEALRDVDVITRGYQCNYDAIEELADRIHELTRWIPVSERMPTEKDADTRGKVMWYFWGEHYESRYWNLHSDYGATHWKRITPPEGV
jgi:hypothetical protein